MMKRDKRKGPQSNTSSKPHTEVHCGHDLHAILKELTEGSSHGRISRLEELLSSLAKEFLPSTVTMTATNIPDAIHKLSSVVSETAEAAQRVLDLAERQNALLKAHEIHSAAAIRILHQAPNDARAALRELEKSSSAIKEMRALSHKIVEAQEFQDLCSQKVEKVIRLLSSIDDRLRLLFEHLHYPLPSDSATGEEAGEGDIGQDAADDILKRFGI